MQWIFIDISVFLVVFLITGFIIPQILLIAFRKNLFDEIDPRKIHQGAVPRLGGIAFFPGIFLGILLMLGLCARYYPGTIDFFVRDSLEQFCFISCAVIMLYLVGMADDLVGVKYRAKFVIQILAAILIVESGITLDNLQGFIGIHELPHWVSVILTILLMVFIINAINLIDGIDGLASGLSALICTFYGCIFYNADIQLFGMLAFATLGTLLPFYFFNVFGNVNKHKKIFMGDTGSLTIGIILSVLCLRVSQIDNVTFRTDSAVMAFSPLLIPCFDVVRVYLYRIKSGRNPFLPDKSHIHHKLLALGMTQKVAMPTIVFASFLLTLFNYWMGIFTPITLLFFIDIVVCCVANMILNLLIKRRQQQQSAQ